MRVDPGDPRWRCLGLSLRSSRVPNYYICRGNLERVGAPKITNLPCMANLTNVHAEQIEYLRHNHSRFSESGNQNPQLKQLNMYRPIGTHSFEARGRNRNTKENIIYLCSMCFIHSAKYRNLGLAHDNMRSILYFYYSDCTKKHLII